MKYILYIAVLFHLSSTLGQVYLNDTSLYNSLWCEDIAVYETDSGFYTLGNIIREGNGNDLSISLGFHHKNGNKELILENYEVSNDQRVFGSIHKLFLNNNGNFVSLYNNCESGVGCYPRLKEISPNGIILNDISYKSVLDSLNLLPLDGNNFLQKKSDSSYLVLANVVDTARSSAPGQAGGGVLYIHLDKNFNLLDTIPFFTSGALINRGYVYAEVVELESGKILLMIPETLQASNPLEEGQIVFIELDAQGNLLNTTHYSDGQKINRSHGLTKTSDDGYLFSYSKGFWNGNSWLYNDYICKVATNFEQIWKMSVDTATWGTGGSFVEWSIEPTFDGNYVTVGGAYRLDSLGINQQLAKLSKFDDLGSVLWQRNHFKVVDTSLLSGQNVEIRSVIATRDSGYCFVGNVIDYPAIFEGYPGHYGYIVKTNCLGFIGNAEAYTSYQLQDNFTVSFYNTSMQAGSYYWDFGDGTTQITNEYIDTVSHSYSSIYDTYEVMLIAYGCYDSLGVRDADTILFNVQPVLHSDPNVVTNGNGYFTMFPNPVSQGENLHIYLNGLNPDNGDVYLNIYSLDGKHVRKLMLSANEGSYEITNTLSRGAYEIVLIQGDDLLEVEKLVVH